MGSHDAKTVTLRFLDENADVLLPSMAACVSDLQTSAEARFGLQPGGYSFFDAYGRLGSSAAIERAVRSSQVLEVRETAEWAKLRVLELKIQELQAKDVAPQTGVLATATATELESLETRVLSKVEERLVEVLRDEKFNLAPETLPECAVSIAGTLAEQKQVTSKFLDAIWSINDRLKSHLLERSSALEHQALGFRLDDLASRLEDGLRTLRVSAGANENSIAEIQAIVQGLTDGTQFHFKDVSHANWVATCTSAKYRSKLGEDISSSVDVPAAAANPFSGGCAYSRKAACGAQAIAYDWSLRAPLSPHSVAGSRRSHQHGPTSPTKASAVRRDQRLNAGRSLPLLPRVPLQC
eukprot:TRINITY_DN5504_c0_g1_i4.p1 TRINITY_DN5504_c0_g1~~TRINITY_DN5504_c0_g1_i4.p1  ORF type:complete len:381 (-),score=78.50 TRINITY_DN5504_c0_g1_i4:214-1272(-)